MILKCCSIVHQVVMHRDLLSHTAKYEAVPHLNSGGCTPETSFINQTVDTVLLQAS